MLCISFLALESLRAAPSGDLLAVVDVESVRLIVHEWLDLSRREGVVLTDAPPTATP